MIPLVASILMLASIVLIFFGLAEPVRALENEAAAIERDDNALTASPFGRLIRMLALMNERESLEDHRASIEKRLLLAGQPGGKIRGSEFLAAAELAGLGAFLVLFVLFAMLGSLGPLAIFFSVLIGAACIWAPHLWLDATVSDRSLHLQRQFPFFIDLAVMTIGAGSTFTETVETYCHDNPTEALAQELTVTTTEMQMGKTLQEGLESMIERIDVDDLKQTLSSIVQGQKLGTPLVEVMREQADVMRFKRSQNAERLAEELKVRIQGPTMLLMISVFLLILGPAFVQMLRGGLF